MPGATLSADPRKTTEILQAAAPLELTDFGSFDCETDQDAANAAEVEVRIEWGKTSIRATEVEGLVSGSVVRLDEPVEHPVRVYADNQLIARGELLVLNDRYALRITDRR